MKVTKGANGNDTGDQVAGDAGCLAQDDPEQAEAEAAPAHSTQDRDTESPSATYMDLEDVSDPNFWLGLDLFLASIGALGSTSTT
jgi:hypothetical protein